MIPERSPDSDKAFKRAIDLDIFSLLHGAPRYAGNFMYMGRAINAEHDYAFKNIDTRRYVHVPATGEVSREHRHRLQQAAR